MKEKIEMPEFKTRGKVKIQLFDEFGGLVEEQEKENFISKGLRESIYKAMIYSLYSMGNLKNPVSSNVFSNPFKRAILTDASHPLSPETEVFVKGKPLAYCDTDVAYSGSSETQGNLNSLESFTRGDQVRFVYDFPTSAANGTFQSIYHYNPNGIVNTGFASMGRKIFTDGNYSVSSAIYSVSKYNNRFYVLSSGKKINVFDESYNFLSKHTINSSMDFYKISIFNDKIYISPYSGGANLHSIPISDMNAVPTAVFTSPTPYGCAKVFKDGAGYLIVTVFANKVQLTKTDSSFSILSNQVFTTNSTSITTAVLFDDGEVRVARNSFYKKDDGSYGVVYESEFYNDSYVGDILIAGDIGDFYISQSGLLIPKVGIASRARLDAPVTKTSANTMKITYDFIFEDNPLG